MKFWSALASWRSLLVAIAVVAAILAICLLPLHLGLDLRGGTQVVLSASDTPDVDVDDDVMDSSLEALRRRVDALGVAEPALQRTGDRRIIVELPGVDDPTDAIETIGRTGSLTFHAVNGYAAADAEIGQRDDGSWVLPDDSRTLLTLAPAALEGSDVGDATVNLTPTAPQQWAVDVDFRDGSAWARLTGSAACASPGDPARRIAIVLDGEMITSPSVGDGVACGRGIDGGSTQITGGPFDESEARELALLIRSGALPVPLEIVSQTTVGPTLGDTAIRASITATIIGCAVTIAFLVAYYRFLGVVATVSLATYTVLSLGALKLIGAVLTLPGIAGFVLAIGMAVDGNVLVFERLKDEVTAGRTIRNASTAAFRRAFSAILDSNVTTLVAGILLYFFASGGVRGFGVTLSIGVAVSMFTSLVVTRALIDIRLALRREPSPRWWGTAVGSSIRTWALARGPSITARRAMWLGISTAALLLALIGIAVKGLEFGLEFTGGRLIEYSSDSPIDPDRARSNLADIGYPRAIVQETDEGISVRLSDLPNEQQDEVRAAITNTQQDDTAGEVSTIRDEFVGATIGDELREKAIIAICLALVAQLIYLAFRFKWTYGASAVIAVFHDAILVVGTFAWLGKEIDGVFVAAMLTVVGYSINDTVVVFDRIRERQATKPSEAFLRSANTAALETLPRTIITGLATMFILIALWALGGDTLTDFALALIIGILAGTYSSVLTATPLLTLLQPSTIATTTRSRPKHTSHHRPTHHRARHDATRPRNKRQHPR